VLAKSLELYPREFVTPWDATHTSFAAQFKNLANAANVGGTWKFLRRGSATDVERKHPGAGSTHLGHVPGSGVAESNYFDQRLLQRDKTMPTELN
jgi:hypothetical protein